MRKLLILVFVVAILVVMLAAGALIVMTPTAVNGAQRLDYGQEIQIDDFAFAALDSAQATTVGTQSAQGVFYVVQFRVTNHARRIGFTFRPETAILMDSAGTEYHVSDTARAAWFAANGKTDPCARELPAGDSCDTTLVYEVPTGSTAPLLRMSFGGQIFDVADALMFGKKVIQLK